MAETGLLYLLQIENDAVPGTYITFSCQENTSLVLDMDAIDTSGKCGGQNRTFIPGMKQWSFSADGSFILADTGYLEFFQTWDTGLARNMQIVRSDGSKWRGSGILTKLQKDFPYDDKAKFSVEVQGTGALSVV